MPCIRRQGGHQLDGGVSEFKAYFERLLKGRRKEKGIMTKMRVKVSAKMLVIAWTLMKTSQPYKAGLLLIDEPGQQRGR
jgi:hypothetical protein